MSQDASRRKALDMAVAAIEKNYGKGAIMRLGADIPAKDRSNSRISDAPALSSRLATNSIGRVRRCK